MNKSLLAGVAGYATFLSLSFVWNFVSIAIMFGMGIDLKKSTGDFLTGVGIGLVPTFGFVLLSGVVAYKRSNVTVGVVTGVISLVTFIAYVVYEIVSLQGMPVR